MLSAGPEKLKNAIVIVLLLIAAAVLIMTGLKLKDGGESLRSGSPAFSKSSGFYNRPFKLKLYAGDDMEIRYTLDGSDPTLDSPLYTEPIEINDRSPEENLYAGNIYTSVDYFFYTDRSGYVLPESPVDKCTVVRAAAFDKDGRKYPTVTESYFIGFNDKPAYRGVPVISLVADPEDLFGYEKGIYVIGKLGTEDFLKNIEKSEEAQEYLKENPDTPLDGSVKVGNIYMHEGYVYNYSQGGAEWEREGESVFFDSWKNRLVSSKLGIRVRGHNSRNFPQKSLSLFERKEYSKEQFYFPYLKNKVKNSVALSGGGDDMYSFIRDPFLSELFRENGLAFGVQEFSEPVYLFLNGEFWGTYLLSEKEDKQYLKRHYGVDEDNTLIVKNGLLDSGTEDAYRGSYGSLLRFVLEHDLSLDPDYAAFSDMVDMESLIDYYAARLYVDDTSDWPKTNVAMWRSVNKTDREYEDGKWRYLNFDNNIELQPGKESFDSFTALLDQGKEAYEDLKNDYDKALSEGSGIESLLNRNRYFDRMIFYCLMQNAGFKESFKKRFTEIEDVVYDTDTALPLLDRIADRNRLPVVSGYSRWFGDRCGVNDFDKKAEEIREFLRNRRQYMDRFLNEI